MFRQLMVLALAAIAGVLLAAPARAADETHEGKVLAVGTAEITVLDNKDGDTDKFVISDATKITRNGKPAKLSDILAGDRAKVVASQVDGKLVAKSIEARTPE